MLARIRKSQKNDEGGFTLIELLVVIIIIGILAAIAIPTFLKQREKGWKAAVKSDLHNAAIAEESYATDNNGDYTTTPDYNHTDKVNVAAALVDTANPAAGYTLTGDHDSLSGCSMVFTSTTGKTVETGC